jgi:hypothetical protein
MKNSLLLLQFQTSNKTTKTTMSCEACQSAIISYLHKKNKNSKPPYPNSESISLLEYGGLEFFWWGNFFTDNLHIKDELSTFALVLVHHKIY